MADEPVIKSGHASGCCTTAVEERPILFSGPMVRAIFDGRKTQTRRIVKGLITEGAIFSPRSIVDEPGMWTYNGRVFRCPYGHPGERLWVRETWAPRIGDDGKPDRRQQYVKYRADNGCEDVSPHDDMDWHTWEDRWRPSIHMPRWASRITLEIVSVRVERLNEISEQDAMAEGCNGAFLNHANTLKVVHSDGYGNSVVDQFRTLWESINGPGSWDANPWVWCMEFKPCDS